MHLNRYARRPAFAVVILSLIMSAGTLFAADENFNWTEASRFVDSFPFPQTFIDSLAAAYQVTVPSPPLRTLPAQHFSNGEMLVYDIGWSFIKGGYVILTAAPDTARHTIKLGAKALSRGFVSTFYRMRDYAISTVDAEGLYPLFFEEHLREGKHYKTNRWFLYDQAGKMLHLRDRTLSVPEFTTDYLSVLYTARTRQFAPGDTFSLPFFVDGKLYRLMFTCTKRETMDFNGKDVRCLLVKPQPADDKGEFNKKKRLEIWLSDDEYKLPIRIKAKITIGSITADLIHVERPKTENHAVPKTPDTASSAATAGNSGSTNVLDTAHVSDSLGRGDTIDALDTTKVADTSRGRDSSTTGDTTKTHDAAQAHDTLKIMDSSKKHDTAAVHDSAGEKRPYR
jgi:hypothetical protein